MHTVDEAKKFNVATLGLIPQKTINDVVATGSLLAHVNNTNLLGLLIDFSKLRVYLLKLRVRMLVPRISQQVILNLNEVMRIWLGLHLREL